MRPWECSQTDRHTDANRFYNLSHAICYSYGTDKNGHSVWYNEVQSSLLQLAVVDFWYVFLFRKQSASKATGVENQRKNFTLCDPPPCNCGESGLNVWVFFFKINLWLNLRYTFVGLPLRGLGQVLIAKIMNSSKHKASRYTVCLKKTSPTFLAVTRESIVGFS